MFQIVEDGKLPEAKNKYSAGYDVFVREDVHIYPGEMRTVKLGFKLDLNKDDFIDYYFSIHLRESAGKKGASLVNGVGIINIDSTEEITLQVFNTLKDPTGYENRNIELKAGEAIAQIVLNKHYGNFKIASKYIKDDKL